MPRQKPTQAQWEKAQKRKKQIAERKFQQATADAVAAGAGEEEPIASEVAPATPVRTKVARDAAHVSPGGGLAAGDDAVADEQPKRNSPKRSVDGRILNRDGAAEEEDAADESAKTPPKRLRQSPPKPQGTPLGLSSPFRRGVSLHPAARGSAAGDIADDVEEAPRGGGREFSPSFFGAGG
ncbi:MAG: hypothetical protein AABY34_06090 [Pseudomonadota bacterium]